MVLDFLLICFMSRSASFVAHVVVEHFPLDLAVDGPRDGRIFFLCFFAKLAAARSMLHLDCLAHTILVAIDDSLEAHAATGVDT